MHSWSCQRCQQSGAVPWHEGEDSWIVIARIVVAHINAAPTCRFSQGSVEIRRIERTADVQEPAPVAAGALTGDTQALLFPAPLKRPSRADTAYGPD